MFPMFLPWLALAVGCLPATTADGLAIACDDTGIELKASIRGSADDAILNVTDFANVPAYHEEHGVPLTNGRPDPLVLPTLPGGTFTPGSTTIYTCGSHVAPATPVMAYVLRLYQAGVLVDCQIGAEYPGGAADVRADQLASTFGGPITRPGELSTCGIGLTLTFP